jgi:hypothetical protein
MASCADLASSLPEEDPAQPLNPPPPPPNPGLGPYCCSPILQYISYFPKPYSTRRKGYSKVPTYVEVNTRCSKPSIVGFVVSHTHYFIDSKKRDPVVVTHTSQVGHWSLASACRKPVKITQFLKRFPVERTPHHDQNVFLEQYNLWLSISRKSRNSCDRKDGATEHMRSIKQSIWAFNTPKSPLG